MPHDIELILTLTGGLTAALLLGIVTQKLRLSPIVGYLLAGIAVGPYTPGFAADTSIATQSAEIGVILLMFGVGLHFHLKDLMAVKAVAVPGALVQIAAATGLGVVATHWFGWSLPAGIVFGIAISVASTVVLTRVLADNNALHTPVGHVAIGWLIVEDLFTVVVLVLLPAFAPGEEGGNVWATLGIALLKLAALVALTFVVGGRVIPKLLGYVARTGSRELFTLTVLVLALGIAVGSAKFFGASMALGAFLAGMITGQSDYSARAASDALPMRDAFAVLFFVSVGMLFDPSAVIDGWPLMLATLAIILVGKPVAAVAVVLALKRPARTALPVAAALSQIGEFSFILAALAVSLGILPPEAMAALVVGAVVSITLNPMIYQTTGPLAKWMEKRGIGLEKANPEGGPVPHHPSADRVIVVGNGPVGRTVTRILADNGIEPVVVDMNPDTVRQLKEAGTLAVHGDASRAEILHHAGIEHAEGLVISASGLPATEIVRAARELNPKVRILSRARYLTESAELRAQGADAVFSSEGEIALSMVDFLMERFGATDEQIERERDRVRKELF